MTLHLYILSQTQGLASSFGLPLLSTTSFSSTLQYAHVIPITYPLATTSPCLPFIVELHTSIFYTCSLCILTILTLAVVGGEPQVA